MAVSSNLFQPTRISGLQLWLDASDPMTIYQDSTATTLALADGDPVGCWKDKSGNARDATQSDGTLKSKIKTVLLNKQAVIYFDGSDIMDIVSFPTLTEATIFAVFKLTIRNLYQNDRIISWRKATNTDDATTTKSYVPLARRYNYNQVSCHYNTTHDNANIDIVSDTWYAYSTSVNSSGLLTNSVNKLTPVTYQGTGFDRGAEIQIGARRGTDGSGNTPNEYALVWLAEIIWYDSALSTTNINKIYSYINSKWGVY